MQDQKQTKPKAPRTLSAYELNQLTKYGHQPSAFVTTQNQPVEYFTGWVTFGSHDFKVTPAVLIPRVETEELLELAFQTSLQQATSLTRPLRILEVGTGSGALGLGLALKLQQADIPYSLLLTDISESALQIAEENQQRLLPAAPITFHLGSVLDDLSPTPFDLILANLPYIPSDRVAHLDSSVRDYEPWLALDGGPDGLRIITALLSQVSHFSHSQTEIWLEVDETHTLTQINQVAPHLQARLVPDSFDKNRFVHLKVNN